MLGLRLGGTNGGVREILCLGAHSDDIEIGCGGTILELVAANPGVRVTWVVFSGDARREREARRAARRFLAGAGASDVIVQRREDGYFPVQAGTIKRFFEKLKQKVSPDLVLTHYRHDRHQDHRTISDLTWNTFRNHLILEYEVPKYDGDLGTPNIFMPLSREAAERKVSDLCSIFESQVGQHWFTPDLFFGLLRLRGIECCAESGYAEAFHGRKAILSPGPDREARRERSPRKARRR